VLIAASIVALAGYVERGHSVVIDPPETVAIAPLSIAATCMDDDDQANRVVMLDEGILAELPPIADPACDRPEMNRGQRYSTASAVSSPR